MLTLRDARPDDVPTVLRFIRELAAFERAPGAVTATEEDVRRHAFGDHPLTHIVMAEWDGTPVGFALWFFNYSTWQGRPGLYLEDLYVEPAHRGRGIGRALLENLARAAVAHGCGRYQWQVLDWNEQAIRVYESLGARRLDEWITMRVEGEALAQLAGR
jgi:GNAT superfamily N-acetyltransferase